jgi:hypothetical protein
MIAERVTNARLLAVAGLAAVLWSYPLLSLVDAPRLILGVPLLYLYLFTVWLVLIGVLALIAER